MLKIRYNGVQGLHFLHCFRLISLLPFSTSSPSTDSFASYLVESLGFSKQQSLSTSAKLSHLRRAGGAKKEVSSDFNFVGKCNSVVTFLNQNGFNHSHIRSIVNSDPLVLLHDVHKTLEPKLKALLDLGLPISDLGPVIVANPSMLRSRLNPAIHIWKQVLGSDEYVVRVLKRWKRNTFSSAAKHLVSNVELLEKNYGISSDVVLKHILYHPNNFAIRPETFRGVLMQVEHKLGIPRHSGMFCYGIHLLVNLSEKKIDSKFGVFKSFGWTDSDVRQLVRCNPYCLMISVERVKRSLHFLIDELQYEPAYLATHPAFLSYSLEKRIVPRYRALQVLKEKGLIKKDYGLYTAVSLSESKFLEKFVLPFQDVVPNLREIYAVTTKE